MSNFVKIIGHMGYRGCTADLKIVKETRKLIYTEPNHKFYLSPNSDFERKNNIIVWSKETRRRRTENAYITDNGYFTLFR